jgi:tetratricopeptide (TPR) repeat protein
VGAERIERWLFEGPPHRIDEALQAHGALHLAAREVRAARQVGERYLEFCRSTLPEVFGRLPAEEASLLGIVAGTLAQLEGPRAAIALVLDRMDLEPTWRIRVGLGVWDHLGWSLANWRHEAGSIGTIEPRLLARVLAGLEDSLVHLNQGAEAGLTHRGYKTFWDEKRNDFAATAAKVAELHGSSPAILLFAANYLRHGLGLLREAVATLQAADERGMLREDGRWTLAVWLVEDKRFAEALPHAERLAREKPENLDYRLLVVQALFGTGRKPEALAALEGTVADWRERKVFDEGVAARTAHLALDIESPARAAEWIEEAIRMRREAGRSPVDGTLSSHYGILARARSLLGQTDAAVQAAAAAVVAWGRDQTNRGQALEALRLVLSTARDLDAFATRYQAEVAKTGLDAPVIRRALGSVFLDAKRYAEAALQLRVARDLAPEDAEVHRLLVKTHDEAGEPAEALAAALTAVRLDPRSVTAYQDLARRYRAAGDLAASERALTGMVEWTANEAEGHRALAQEREGASRLEEAVVQWRLVVRARSLEPDGWLSLAVALGKAGDAEGARATLDEVLARTWDERFGDVRARAAEILRSLPPAPPRPGR